MKRITKEMLYKRIGEVQDLYNKNNIEACIWIQYKPCNIIIARKWVNKPIESIRFKTYTECYWWLYWYIKYFDKFNKELLK